MSYRVNERLSVIQSHLSPSNNYNQKTQLSSSSCNSLLQSGNQPGVLDVERVNATFNIRELTYILDGSKENTMLKEEIQQLLEEDPVFGQIDKYDLSIFEDRELTMKKMLQFFKLKKMIGADQDKEKYSILYALAALSDQAFVTRYGVHYGLFRDNVIGQGTQELIHEILPLIESNKVIGCFCMTEMGHGSYLRGLETIATFDKSSQEFIIHSPTLTSTKWWIGAAGQTANYSVVFAQLIIDGKSYGVHSFVVPLRDLETHKPLPGIIIGDLGNKQGKQGVDNGYVQFNQVRIPRTNMLMKWSVVTPEGKYLKPPGVAAQLAYGPLVSARISIVAQAANDLMRVLTTAIRYSCVRRQFHTTDPANETKLLDYQQHQYRLLPLISQAYAMTFVSQKLLKIKDELDDAFERGVIYPELSNLHSDTAGLKAYTTWMTNYGLEDCRHAMGGHGFSLYSGVGQQYNDYTVNCTWEGDNTIMAMQMSRHLIKSFSSARKGTRLTGSISYLNNFEKILSSSCPTKSEADFLNPNVQLEIYRYYASRLIANASMRLHDEISKRKNEEEAWNNCQIDLIKCAKAHSFLYLVDTFIHTVSNVESAGIRQALKDLCDLFLFYHLENDGSVLFTEGYMDAQQFKMISKILQESLKKVRVNAIAFVDAFNFSDYIINSPLGRYDGNIYPAYFSRVIKNPLNSGVAPYYETILKPVFTTSQKQH